VATSENATLFWPQQSFTPAQRAYIERSIKDTYKQFTEGVAAGRNMSVEAVDKIGKGRVWTGTQAKEIGLVDELGGIDRAVEVAKQLARIPPSQTVHIVRFPEEKTLFQILFERERDQLTEGRAQALSSTMTSTSNVRALARMLQEVADKMDPVQARIPFELRIR